MSEGTYWKVVFSTLPGRYSSCWADGECRLEYPLGERIDAPEGTGLLAFDDEEAAEAWAEKNTCWRILKGRGAPGPPLPEYRLQTVYRRYHATDVWRDAPERPTYNLEYWPEGTVSLAWFEPEEVVT